MNIGLAETAPFSKPVTVTQPEFEKANDGMPELEAKPGRLLVNLLGDSLTPDEQKELQLLGPTDARRWEILVAVARRYRDQVDKTLN